MNRLYFSNHPQRAHSSHGAKGGFAALNRIAVQSMLIGLLSVQAGCGNDVSGSYVARSASAVYLLQLVSTPGGHVTGQLEISELGSDGKIDQDAMIVSGTIDGTTVDITLKPHGIFLPAVPMSGTFRNDVLTVTIGAHEKTPLVFREAAGKDYASEKLALKNHPQSAHAAASAHGK